MAPDSDGGPLDLSFFSRRSAVYARAGMAASSQPLATQVGVSVLRKGGNAADAAVAMAAVGLLDDGCDPQDSLDAPRFCVEPRHPSGLVYLEEGAPPQLAAALSARGHEVRAGISGYERSLFGRGQVIVRRPDGVLCAGSDPRADGCAAGF